MTDTDSDRLGTGSPYEDCPTNNISEENPFRDQIIDMASDGRSWLHIYKELEECLDAVDEKAVEEVDV